MVSNEKVLIVESSTSGHRLYYVKLLAQSAVDRGADVSILLPRDARLTGEFGLFLQPLEEFVTVFEADDMGLNEIEHTSNLVEATKTVIADADLWVPALLRRGGWRGSGTMSLLIMRASTQPGRFAGIDLIRTAAKRLLMLSLSLLPGVNLRVLRSAMWTGRSLFKEARDPTTLSTTATSIDDVRRHLQIDPATKWVAVIGAISDRKNLSLVAASLASLNRNDVGLLVAGKCKPGTLEIAEPYFDAFRKSGGTIITEDRLLNDIELDSIVGIAHCVAIAHSNEGPSGLFGKAAASGTFVVAAGAKTLQQDAKNIPSIASWVPLEVPQLARAFARTLDLPKPTAVAVAGTARFTEALL
jgi:hypothetical protein